jgi:DNA-binding LytR/AlgR family response regulator
MGAADLLRGRRLLVVEDDYLIAADVAASLGDFGAIVIGPAGSIEDALRLIGAHDRIDAAVLDVNLRGERVYAVADALRARGVPFVFATGYDAGMLPERYEGVPRCGKPVNVGRLAELLSSMKPRFKAAPAAEPTAARQTQ